MPRDHHDAPPAPAHKLSLEDGVQVGRALMPSIRQAVRAEVRDELEPVARRLDQHTAELQKLKGRASAWGAVTGALTSALLAWISSLSPSASAGGTATAAGASAAIAAVLALLASRGNGTGGTPKPPAPPAGPN